PVPDAISTVTVQRVRAGVRARLADSPRAMSTDLVFPVQVVLAFLAWGLLARWYLTPRLRGLPSDIALAPLLVVQTIRYIGLSFLAPAVVKPTLAQNFAVPAA